MGLPGWLRTGVEVRVVGLPLVLALPFLTYRSLQAAIKGRNLPNGLELFLLALLLLTTVVALLFLVELLDAAGLIRWRAGLAGRLGLAVILYLIIGVGLRLTWDGEGLAAVVTAPFELMVWPKVMAWKVACPSRWWACFAS